MKSEKAKPTDANRSYQIDVWILVFLRRNRYSSGAYVELQYYSTCTGSRDFKCIADST
jgi:hypothetical protein